MIVDLGYRKYNTYNYIVTYDNDYMMLECFRCHSRMKAINYFNSVGTEGLTYCPYCGQYMKDGCQEELDLCH